MSELRLKAPETLEGSFEIHQPGGDAKPVKVKCVFRCTPGRKELLETVRQGQLVMMAGLPGFAFGQAIIKALSLVFPKLKPRVLKYADMHAFLDSILVSWEGVDMPWSREACDNLLMMYPGANILILGAWAQAHKEARLGN